ncbi:rhomboid family intramembrane serine protease [Zhouia spongiae]|uniref:Rhomboid family intramembrane serine protease n=1 Tax=Zhouia spongiae TaxID=2202721 RepID=A0ABY3YMI6_9FLAO|nr:rhomboid family intramembrane serine protease [Zhouia spongiae]UNY98814.1 rhomboid family intramembrane serine protease [Zhouia spongiae]
MGRISDTVKHLIIINVLFWVATIVLRKSGIDLEAVLALHFPLNEAFKPWQIITHMFMHATFTANGGIVFAHILFNMFGLWMFGTPLEQMWGRNKFLFFYLFAGIGSAIVYSAFNFYQFFQASEILNGLGFNSVQVRSLLSLPHDQLVATLNSGVYDGIRLDRIQEIYDEGYFAFNSVAVGASGALYGILVAFAMMFPNAELMLIFLPIPIKAKYFVPILILGDLFFGFTQYSIGPIAHFAHVGGALFGFIMMWYWKRNQFNKNRWDR